MGKWNPRPILFFIWSLRSSSCSSTVGRSGANVGAPTDSPARGGERAGLTAGEERPSGRHRRRVEGKRCRMMTSPRTSRGCTLTRTKRRLTIFLIRWWIIMIAVVVTCLFGRHYSLALSGTVWDGLLTLDFFFFLFFASMFCKKGIDGASEFGLKHFARMSWERWALHLLNELSERNEDLVASRCWILQGECGADDSE